MTHRFVVLGLAGGRAPWFAEVGQWSHAGSVPVEFVKCVSAEQLRTRLSSGRLHSAAVVDGALASIDRDLIDAVHRAGAAVVVTDADCGRERWTDLGVDAVLPATFGPGELIDVLRTHAAMVPSTDWRAQPTAAPARAEASPLIALCGPGGTGVSTLSIALAQQLATDTKRHSRGVLLADLCRRAEQGVLHDADELGPGIQELVDACRTAAPADEQTLAYTFAVTERAYALLLGLRRPTAWATLRPRAVAVAIGVLRRAFDVVVCDCDRDVESQADGGSLDVEERNALTRAAILHADVTFAVGTPGLKGVYAVATLVNEIVDAGVESGRVVPVFNRAGRGPRFRAATIAAFGTLLSDASRAQMPSPIFVSERDVDSALHDRRRLSAAVGDPLVGAFHAACAPTTRVETPAAGARRVQRGEVVAWPEEVSAS